MTTRTHAMAVKAALDAASGLTPADAPVVELAKTLAAQMDLSGPDGPSTRLAGTYLTCLRALAVRAGPAVEVRATSPLAELRAKHTRREATRASKGS